MKRLLDYFMIFMIFFICSCSEEKTSPVLEKTSTDSFYGELVYSRSITVYDSSQSNFIILKLHAKSEDEVAKFLSNWKYSLKVMYNNDKNVSQVETFSGDSTEFVQPANFCIEMDSVNIDEKASGFALNALPRNKLKSANADYDWYYYEFPKRWHWVQISLDEKASEGIIADFYTKYNWLSSYKRKMHKELTPTNRFSGPFHYSEYRISIRVYANHTNYYMYCKKWEEDQWEYGTQPSNWL